MTIELKRLLIEASDKISIAEEPSSFDFEKLFVNLGCESRIAELLPDYLPSACGRGFLREIGIVPSNEYQRRQTDGSWGQPQRYNDDPIWNAVEMFVEQIRLNPDKRKQFSLIAQHSAEIDAVNKALNSGQSLDDLVGATVNGVFNSPLEFE